MFCIESNKIPANCFQHVTYFCGRLLVNDVTNQLSALERRVFNWTDHIDAYDIYLFAYPSSILRMCNVRRYIRPTWARYSSQAPVMAMRM